MTLSRTEVNLRRLLATAPQQKNQAKLIHYVATLREQLEQLAEKTPEGLPRVSKAQSNEYTEKIEGIAAKISTTEQSTKQVSQDPSLGTSDMQILSKEAGESVHSPRGLRRRLMHPTEDRSNDTVKFNNIERSVKLDSAAQAHIEKHRKLQDDLTDEMVGLARQLKESTLMMSQSIQNTEKILDSTEKAVEQSLARTGHVNSRAMEVYSQTFKTSCATWLAVFVMVCIFIMVVLLIRVT